MGDTVTEEVEGKFRICSFLKFKTMYENEKTINLSLKPAKNFVDALSYSNQLGELIESLKNIMIELETKTKVESSFKY